MPPAPRHASRRPPRHARSPPQSVSVTPVTRAQSGKRTFQRRTKATPAPSDNDVTTTPATDEKLPKRGPSRFKSRESARNETSAARRPATGAGARRTERPATRNFVRRRPAAAGAANVTASTSSLSAAVPSSAATRRPFRIASRRRPATSSSTTTTTTTTTTPPPTLALESEESLQDIGDIDAIEDPSLEPRTAKRPAKTPRRPLVNLKEEPKDQNPSATNEDERKRQSKKYSSTFKQNQLDDLLKVKSGEVTTESGTTVEEYNAETALALATHQLITAPLPVTTDFEEGTKPTRAKTTQKYKETTEFTNTPKNEDYSTATFRTIPSSQDFIQSTIRDAYNIYDIPSLSTFYEDSKTTADFTTNSRRPYTATYEPSTNYDTAKTTDVSTTDSKQSTQDIDAGKVTGFISTDTYPTVERESYTNIPTSYAPVISTTTFEIPKQSGTFSRYSTTPIYQTFTDQYVPTTREYAETPERTLAFSTQTAKAPRGFSSPNVITPGYSGVQRGGTKYLNPNDNAVTPTADSDGYSTTGYRSSSQDPAYFTRDYLLESPVTKTYDDEYQYLSPTSPQTSAPRKFRKKIQRKISTTLRPTSTTPTYVPEVATRPSRITFFQDTTSPRVARPSRISSTQDDLTTPVSPSISYASESTTRTSRPSRVSYVTEEATPAPSRASYVPEVSETPKPSRLPSNRPFEKVSKVEPNRTRRPVVNYDYYDDSAERVALKYAEGTKVILHGRGSIECLDVGNFPHPSSCKKFISCARMEFGSLLGWEYVCPKGLSFDPVGGICNWSAGLGCDEKDE